MCSKGLIVVMMDVYIVAVDEDFDVDNELMLIVERFFAFKGLWALPRGWVVSVYSYEDANVDVDPPPCRDLVKCDVSVRDGVKNW